MREEEHVLVTDSDEEYDDQLDEGDVTTHFHEPNLGLGNGPIFKSLKF